MTSLLPPSEQQYIDENGDPYVGATLSYYVPGTLTFKDTYTDSSASVVNPNPVVLDSAGRAIVYGTGDYRCILRDQNGVLIYDQLTSATLADSAISTAMLPVVGAATLATARDLMGVSGAISTAIGNVQLMPGPTGPVGPIGPCGPQGPQGPQGDSGSAGVNASGVVTVAAGSGTTDSIGNFSVSWSPPFAHAAISFSLTAANPTINPGSYYSANQLDGLGYPNIPGTLSTSGCQGGMVATTYITTGGDDPVTNPVTTPQGSAGFNFLVMGY